MFIRCKHIQRLELWKSFKFWVAVTTWQLRKQNLENRVSGTNVLNKEFTNIEITKVLTKSKLKKAVGPDNLPNEVLKWPQSVSLLTTFINRILQTRFTPKIWRQALLLNLFQKIP